MSIRFGSERDLQRCSALKPVVRQLPYYVRPQTNDGVGYEIYRAVLDGTQIVEKKVPNMQYSVVPDPDFTLVKLMMTMGDDHVDYVNLQIFNQCVEVQVPTERQCEYYFNFLSPLVCDLVRALFLREDWTEEKVFSMFANLRDLINHPADAEWHLFGVTMDTLTDVHPESRWAIEERVHDQENEDHA